MRALEASERERDLLRSASAKHRAALAAALGWPGGISEPLRPWRDLLWRVGMQRAALDAIVRVLGPQPPTCDGCAAEIAEALRLARIASP